jgi:hypothetical protein
MTDKDPFDLWGEWASPPGRQARALTNHLIEVDPISAQAPSSPPRPDAAGHLKPSELLAAF